MDPVTAFFNQLGEFWVFAATAQGQLLIADCRTEATALLKLFHQSGTIVASKLGFAAPAVPTAPGANPVQDAQPAK